ncbi:hypothetical protein ADIARSV_1524 [Arcticibacter svalbardensis MN12-7]|uniref:Uncharacterized protein n=1 Tax=Arcticibacter svalbardensis MN12-7 TaxID=1150600 RepID=R9GUD9_9SPHI|nr:hypothetical protein ADIARSV_1524 [Arcticibacter svalbardensis MN12-7]
MAVEALASCKAIVFTNIKGLGNLMMLIFTVANALEADTSFFKISTSFSISVLGGNKGKSLNGFDLS